MWNTHTKRKITVQRMKRGNKIIQTFWIKLRCRFSKYSTFETWLSTLASTEVLNKDLRSELVFVSRVFLLFDINVKERSSGYEVVKGLNKTKERWDNARVRINSALIVFRPCFSKFLYYYTIIVKNFFEGSLIS